MRAADIVSDAVKELQAQIKEIKQGNDDDLATLAEKFDAIAGVADKAASKLSAADKALGDEEESEDTGEDEEGEEEDTEQQGEEQVQ